MDIACYQCPHTLMFLLVGMAVLMLLFMSIMIHRI
jgi:hypothetical protein